jgi:hypothetical protein
MIAHQPVGNSADSLKAGPMSHLETEESMIRKRSRLMRGVGSIARLLQKCPVEACKAGSRDENGRTSICNSLQPWDEPEAMSIAHIHASPHTSESALFFNLLQVKEKMMDGLGLAHRLRDSYAYVYGHDNYQSVPIDGGRGLSTPPKRRQMACYQCRDLSWRADPAGVRPGFAFSRL